MLEEQQIDVYEAPTFTKALKKLTNEMLEVIGDEIDRIVKNPSIGERKKGDLEYLYVHKFKINDQVALLGYSWEKDELTVHLLQFGTHENFYQKAKKSRKSDLKLISSK